ncbi:MAG: transglutaminase family protein [Ignavibacteriae bacterium]|nr:transglutaminase family protein [Ignavibacteriota bacterium]
MKRTKDPLLPNGELQHLIKLLDDESDFVYENVKERLIYHGDNSINFIKEYADLKDPLIMMRANEIISMINFDQLYEKFRNLRLRNNKDLLEEAVFLISMYGYPDVNIENYKMILDKMALDIEKRIDDRGLLNHSTLDTINIINDYLFVERKFYGNSDNYYDPDNSFINKVLDKKVGIPVTISILYILLAKRLNLPIFGVNLPSHFIIKYQDSSEEFFIDPFNKGIVISRDEVIQFLDKLGLDEEEFNHIPYLKIAEDKEIIKRVFANLINVYEKDKDELRISQIKKLSSHFD